MSQHLPQSQTQTDESFLSRGALNVLRDYYRSWKQNKRPAKKKVKLTWKQRISLLTFSQWMYFVAVLLFISMGDKADNEETNLLTVGLVAGIGLSREIWYAFHRIWHTTFGKGIFFVLYAATANFALAIAAVKVNAISGIEPAPLRFTLGFTTLVMLPFWIFIASIFLAAGLLLVSNVWLFVAVMLRLIRIRVPAHWEDKSFAFISMLLRIFLLPIVISAMFLMFKPYFKQLSDIIELPDIPMEIISSELSEEERKEIEGLSTEEQRQAVKTIFQNRRNASDSSDNEKVLVTTNLGTLNISPASSESTVAASENTDQSAPEQPQEDEGPSVVDKMIAAFIYNMETYRYSACSKADNQRVLRIDENSVLLAERDDSPLGFRFSVAACDYIYDQPAATTAQ